MPLNTNNVRIWLENHGLANKIIHLGQTAATAQNAADALHCSVSQIAKSLIFYNPQSNTAFLIIASGSNRVDKEKVGEYLGQKIKTASPEFVLAVTGYPVGAVPPVAHQQHLRVLFDAGLLQYPTIFAAAGGSHDVFSIPPQQLLELCRGEIVKIS